MTASSRLLFGLCLVALSAVAASQNAYTTQSTDVYAGPDDSYPPVDELAADAPVQVMGCLDDWSWCDVAYGDDRGWVYAPDVIYQYQDGYVPLYTYAPSLGIPIVVFSLGDYWGHYYRGRPWYGHRDEWEHREHSHHRPPGPPPSTSAPPLAARVERPHGGRPGQEHERPFRLGEANPNQGSNRPPPDRARPQPPEERAPGRADNQPREENRAREATPPHETTPPHQQPQSGRAEPPSHEQHPPARPEASREEHPAKPDTHKEEHPQEPPR
jgi:uncharacterized protein YraI